MRRGAARDIAIVGMGCRFAGAPDLFAFWANILANRDVLREVPADRWPVATFHDPASDANDRVSCRRGGYLESPIPFDPTAHGIMPLAVAGGEPEQFLVLDTARAALADAGMDPDRVGHLRVEVVIGRGNYFNRGNLTRLQHGRIVAQTVGLLAALHPEWTSGGSRGCSAGPQVEPAPVRGGDDPRPAHQRDRRAARGPAGPDRGQLRRRRRQRLVAGRAGPRPPRPSGSPGRSRPGGRGVPRGGRRLPAGLPATSGAVALGRVTAVLGRRGRDDPGRGRRRRGAEEAPRRRARRRSDLRCPQGSRVGQRRPEAGAHLAQRQGTCPRDTPGLPRRGDRTARASHSSKATGSESRPPIARSCGPCVQSSRPRGA